MRVLLVLLVVVGAVGLCAGDRCYRECAKKKGQVRLDSQEVRINHLTAKIQGIEDEFESKLEHGSDNHNILAALGSRLDGIDGMSECHKNEFSCGGNSNECVDNLLVCDGVKDCKNGHDEEDATCYNPVPAGTKYSGVPIRDECTQRKPYEISIIVTDTERPAWYTNNIKVRASILTRSKDRFSTSTANLQTSGYYCFATRRLILMPPESDRLGVIVDFNTGDAKSANAYVVRESNLDRCGLFVVHKD